MAVREPIIGEEDLFTQVINKLAFPILNPHLTGHGVDDELDLAYELYILGAQVRTGALAIALALNEIAVSIRRASE